MRKRFLASLFTFVLLFSLAIPANAADQIDDETALEAEIQRQVDSRMALVQPQLENLDPGYERAYRSYLSEQIRYELLGDAGISTMATRYYMNNGGVVTYVTFDELTGDRYEVAVTLLDRQRTLDFILEGADFNLADIVRTALGYLPYVGGVISAVFAVDAFCSESTLEDIRDAGGYTQITSIKCTSYPVGDPAVIVFGWDEHPYFTRPSNATSVSVEWFPPYEV